VRVLIATNACSNVIYTKTRGAINDLIIPEKELRKSHLLNPGEPVIEK